MAAHRKILYCGDSEAGGAANYLLACLAHGRFQVTHLPPAKMLAPALLRTQFDAILFSDYAAEKVPAASQRRIEEHVRAGRGFMMIGGWCSFAARYGKWKNSRIENLLPVSALHRDDRRNFPSGLLMTRKAPHTGIFRGLNLNTGTPVICGLNELKARSSGRVLLSARELRVNQGRIAATGREFPLLTISRDPSRRVAAFATDFAPHWCGGLVDWGRKRLTLPVNSRIRVEVGGDYARFIVNLVNWLSKA